MLSMGANSEILKKRSTVKGKNMLPMGANSKILKKGSTVKGRNMLLIGSKFFPFKTVNPLYTDTRYNDKICYNDSLNVTKPPLKR